MNYLCPNTADFIREVYAFAEISDEYRAQSSYPAGQRGTDPCCEGLKLKVMGHNV